MPDVGISWNCLPTTCGMTNIVPGDCHGPYGPRNDIFVGACNIPSDMSFRGGRMPDVGISWYCLPTTCGMTSIVPGDCHGPYGPRNDIEIKYQC